MTTPILDKADRVVTVAEYNRALADPNVAALLAAYRFLTQPITVDTSDRRVTRLTYSGGGYNAVAEQMRQALRRAGAL